MIELHNVKPNTFVEILETPRQPPASIQIDKNNIVKVGRLDGMYVNCIDSHGNRVYLAAWTKVRELNELAEI